MSVSVLLVEDKDANLKAKKGLLKELGCGPVVGVRDPDSAIAAVRTLPHFDLIIADIDLSDASTSKTGHNKGGVEVARWLKATKYPAFVTGYSGFFKGDEITESDRSVFDDFVDRSVGMIELTEKFGVWIGRARNADRGSHLRDLILEAYEASTASAARKHVPVVSLDTLVDYEGNHLEELRADGYKLSLVLPDVDEEIKRAFPVWIKKVRGEVSIEVVGQPYLFASGGSEKEAQDALRALILGYHSDLGGKDPNRDMGPYVKIMFRFLESLFK